MRSVSLIDGISSGKIKIPALHRKYTDRTELKSAGTGVADLRHVYTPYIYGDAPEGPTSHDACRLRTASSV
jgi:hypothetical protein